jgi:hypothetical protein
MGASGRIRTCDARFRKPTLYPLSYGGTAAAGPLNGAPTTARVAAQAATSGGHRTPGGHTYVLQSDGAGPGQPPAGTPGRSATGTEARMPFWSHDSTTSQLTKRALRSNRPKNHLSAHGPLTSPR